MMNVITIKANAVTDNGNGTFSLDIPCKELSFDQAKMLESLFPNLLGEVFKTLNKETLLGCLATENEITAPPKKKKSSFVEQAMESAAIHNKK